MARDFKSLMEHFRETPNSVFTQTSLTEQLRLDNAFVKEGLEELIGQKSIYDLGDGRYTFSMNRELIAFEIFRNIAPNVTFEEYQKYQHEPHLLMRLSRDRMMNSGFFIEEEVIDERRTRGNPLRF